MEQLINQDLDNFLYTLAEDVVTERVSPQFLGLSFSNEPVKFEDAPTDVILVQLADYLTDMRNSVRKEPNLGMLKGSIFIKVSNEMLKKNNLNNSLHAVTDKDFLYIEHGYFREYPTGSTIEIETVNKSIYICKKEINKECYVVPLTEILVNGKSLIKDLASDSELSLHAQDVLSNLKQNRSGTNG